MKTINAAPMNYHRNLIAWLLVPAIAAALSSSAPAEELSDDFNDSGTLGAWKIREDVEGGQKTYETIQIGKTRQGWLTVVPRPENAWYRDGMGPMLFKELDGDFLVETRVVTESRNQADAAPRAQYNSAGLIVRDPASKRGSQNWFVVNVGYQAQFAGSEAKTTVNSDSNLQLQRGSHNGRLRLARIGTTIYALRMLEGERRWTLIRQVDRPDLPSRVQVGLMANGWTRQADLIAHFDYIRFTKPSGAGDLTSAR